MEAATEEATEEAVEAMEEATEEATRATEEEEATRATEELGGVEVVAVGRRRRRMTASRSTRPWRSWPQPSRASRSWSRRRQRRRRGSWLPQRLSQPPSLISSCSYINLNLFGNKFLYPHQLQLFS